MGLFKKLKEKAQAIKDNVDLEELQNRATETYELLQDESVGTMTKVKAAGSFVKDLGNMTKGRGTRVTDEMAEELGIDPSTKTISDLDLILKIKEKYPSEIEAEEEPNEEDSNEEEEEDDNDEAHLLD